MEGCWGREQKQGQSLSISQPGRGGEEKTSGRQEEARHGGLSMNQGTKCFRLDKITDPVGNSIRLRRAPRLRMTGPYYTSEDSVDAGAGEANM